MVPFGFQLKEDVSIFSKKVTRFAGKPLISGFDRKCVSGPKKELIFELSASDYVGFILKIPDICLL